MVDLGGSSDEEQEDEQIHPDHVSQDEESVAEEEDEDLQGLSEKEFQALKLSRFGLREINNEPAIKQRLYEVRKNFYNRLESKKLIKKFGRIPFTEHMTITNSKPCEMGEA